MKIYNIISIFILSIILLSSCSKSVDSGLDESLEEVAEYNEDSITQEELEQLLISRNNRPWVRLLNEVFVNGKKVKREIKIESLYNVSQLNSQVRVNDINSASTFSQISIGFGYDKNQISYWRAYNHEINLLRDLPDCDEDLIIKTQSTWIPTGFSGRIYSTAKCDD